MILIKKNPKNKKNEEEKDDNKKKIRYTKNGNEKNK